jgi:hypothetical protein
MPEVIRHLGTYTGTTVQGSYCERELSAEERESKAVSNPVERWRARRERYPIATKANSESKNVGVEKKAASRRILFVLAL